MAPRRSKSEMWGQEGDLGWEMGGVEGREGEEAGSGEGFGVCDAEEGKKRHVSICSVYTAGYAEEELRGGRGYIRSGSNCRM